jgi:lipoprotein Spr/probable lipoprotein NlpC
MKKRIFIWAIVFIVVQFNSCKSSGVAVNTTSSKQSKLEQVYKKYKGTPYKYGGTTSRGFDCSGFVQRTYMDAFKQKLPRTTKAMMKKGKKISKSQLEIGDLVFFHPTRRYYHVGIYLGNGTFMHASSSRGVIKSKLSLKYWQKSYVTARRVQ